LNYIEISKPDPYSKHNIEYIDTDQNVEEYILSHKDYNYNHTLLRYDHMNDIDYNDKTSAKIQVFDGYIFDYNKLFSSKSILQLAKENRQLIYEVLGILDLYYADQISGYLDYKVKEEYYKLGIIKDVPIKNYDLKCIPSDYIFTYINSYKLMLYILNNHKYSIKYITKYNYILFNLTYNNEEYYLDDEEVNVDDVDDVVEFIYDDGMMEDFKYKIMYVYMIILDIDRVKSLYDMELKFDNEDLYKYIINRYDYEFRAIDEKTQITKWNNQGFNIDKFKFILRYFILLYDITGNKMYKDKIKEIIDGCRIKINCQNFNQLYYYEPICYIYNFSIGKRSKKLYEECMSILSE
jgi:hypothetical protein